MLSNSGNSPADLSSYRPDQMIALFVKKNGSNAGLGFWSSSWQTTYYATDHSEIQVRNMTDTADHLAG